jgi:hypothetical protein
MLPLWRDRVEPQDDVIDLADGQGNPDDGALGL